MNMDKNQLSREITPLENVVISNVVNTNERYELCWIYHKKTTPKNQMVVLRAVLRKLLRCRLRSYR